eukprot:jgi/Tetstr1/465055/TSEL_009783.t1
MASTRIYDTVLVGPMGGRCDDPCAYCADLYGQPDARPDKAAQCGGWVCENTNFCAASGDCYSYCIIGERIGDREEGECTIRISNPPTSSPATSSPATSNLCMSRLGSPRLRWLSALGMEACVRDEASVGEAALQLAIFGDLMKDYIHASCLRGDGRQQRESYRYCSDSGGARWTRAWAWTGVEVAGVAAMKVNTSDGVGRLSSEMLALCEVTFW